jgi:hypothetical protein
VTALVAALVAVPSATLPAEALSEGVGFTGDVLPTWQTNGIVFAMAAAGGTIYAGGTFTTVRPPGTAAAPSDRAAVNFVALDAATGTPTDCTLSFTIASGTATVRALALSPDQRTLYVGGSFGAVNGVGVSNLVAIDTSTCTLAPRFRPAVSAPVRAIAASGDTVYIGGDFGAVGEQPRSSLAALTTDGGVRDWVADADKPVRALALTPDGSSLLVGGDFDRVAGLDSNALAVIDAASGAVRRAYPNFFIHRNSAVKDIAVDDTGFYIGAEGTGGGVFDGRAAFDLTTFDQRWRDTCLGATQAVLPHNGVLYSGHHLHDCASMNIHPDRGRQYLTAQRTTTDATFLGWYPNTNAGIGEGIGPRDLVIGKTASGVEYLWLAGEFTTVNGRPQQALARFGTGPDTGAPSQPQVSVASLRPGQVDVRIQASTDTDDTRLTYLVFRDGGSTPVWSGTMDSLWYVRPQLTFVDENRTPGTLHTYRVRATDGATSSVLSAPESVTVAGAAPQYAAAVLADEPTLYLRYEEPAGSTFAADSSAGLADGTYTGGTQRAAGALSSDASQAVTLNGSASYLFTDQRRPAPLTFSVETWFRTTTTRGGRLVGFGNGNERTSSSYDRHIYMTNDGRLVFGVSTGTAVTLETARPYNDGQWHHVVATHGPEGMGLYVDGVRVALNGTTSNRTYPGYWRVGGDNLNNWPNRPTSRFFAGDIDETAVYTTPLTPSRVAAHFSASGRALAVVPEPQDAYGQLVTADRPVFYWRLDEASGSKAEDHSGGGLTGLYASAVTLGATSPLPTGSAVSLQGSLSSTVTASSSSGTPAAVSMESWVRTSSVRGGRVLGIGNAGSGPSSATDRVVYMRNDGRLVFGALVNGSRVTVTSVAAFNDNRWHHVVATQGSDGMRLYVDGNLVASNTTTTASSSRGFWRLGGDSLTGWPTQPSDSALAGDVDEVAVYYRSLTAGRVFQHYATAVPSADTTAPDAVGDLTATASADGVIRLNWAPATDNVAITSYEVHRSTDPVFTPSPDTLVTTVEGTTTIDTPTPGQWTYRVRATDSAGNTGAPSAPVTLDTAAPGAVGDLTATASADGVVQLAWPAATDNVAVTGYEVHRSTDPGFSPSPETLLTTVEGTTTNDSPPPGQWTYRVRAKDGAGNTGPASAPVTLDTAAPVKVDVAPTSDTYVNQGAPSVNYGSDTSLVSRGTSGYSSYLRFPLPQAPAGRHLVKATLVIRTTTIPTAGSVDAHQVSAVMSPWSETGTTWSTRPTVSATALGTLTGATALGTTYSVNLDPSGVGALLGAEANLAITSTGTDTLWFASREATTNSQRPRLVLEFALD